MSFPKSMVGLWRPTNEMASRLRTQLGPARHDHLTALEAKWDPEGLLNAGLL